MKPALLSLSLVANAVLLAGVAYLALNPRAPQAPEKPKESATLDASKPTSPSPGAATGASATPTTASMPGAWQSPADVEAWLRSSDAPLEVRYAVAEAMLRKKYTAAYAAARHPPGTKKWQRSIPPTPEQKEQMAAVNRQQEQEMKQLLGAGYLQARYGEAENRSGMPADKIAEINRISRDYMEARLKLGRAMTSDGERLMNEEMNADLRKILTPAEYELHQAYESQEGQNLQRSMAGLDIDDETYLQAWRAVAEVRAGSQQPRYSRDVRLAEIQAIEKATGPEVAAHISMNQNATYREVGALFSGSLPAAAMLGKYQTWLQFYKATEGWGPSTQLTDSHLTLVRSYRDRLTEGLSADDRTKFDRTATGAFMARLLRGK